METLNTTTGKIVNVEALSGNHALTNWIHDSGNFKKHDGDEEYWFSADQDTIEWWDRAWDKQCKIDAREANLTYTQNELTHIYCSVEKIDFTDLEISQAGQDNVLDILEFLYDEFNYKLEDNMHDWTEVYEFFLTDYLKDRLDLDRDEYDLVCGKIDDEIERKPDIYQANFIDIVKKSVAIAEDFKNKSEVE